MQQKVNESPKQPIQTITCQRYVHFFFKFIFFFLFIFIFFFFASLGIGINKLICIILFIYYYFFFRCCMHFFYVHAYIVQFKSMCIRLVQQTNVKQSINAQNLVWKYFYFKRLNRENMVFCMN